MPVLAAKNPIDRATIARIAAAERWGRTSDRSAATAPARAGLREKFAREIDPDGQLPSCELEPRIDQLVSAHMQRMSLKAAQQRRNAREATVKAEAAEVELANLGGDAA